MKTRNWIWIAAALLVVTTGAAPSLENRATTGSKTFYVPKGTRNLALNKDVTASDKEPIIGEVELITDGDKSGSDGCFVEFGPGLQYAQIDLGARSELYAIALWHYHAQVRVYFDVVARVSDDPNFIRGVLTIYNNDHDNSSGLGVGAEKEYIETYKGRLIDAGGVRGRYVRLYSKGNTSNELNHYIEIEIYGRPVSEIGPDEKKRVMEPKIDAKEKPFTTNKNSKTESQKRANLTPLRLTLPPPMFKSTPRDVRSPNLEGMPRQASRPPRRVAVPPRPNPRPAPPRRVASRWPAPTPVPVAPSFHQAIQPSPIDSPRRHSVRVGNAEAYEGVSENPFLDTRAAPLSTFSIDVDTASYSNMRRFLKCGQLPPKDSIRVEEWINYFSYDYPEPLNDHPFSVQVEIADCPWNSTRRLARIGLRGRDIDWRNRPSSNLVFLLDVSGSMSAPNKLPLVKQAMHLMLERLGENDRVAIVVYAGASGLILPSTTCDRGKVIEAALNRLHAGGSTNGASGIQLAYRVAAENYLEGAVNRVILATDGDFNVGVTDRADLVSLVQKQAKSGTFLTVLGFGMGNLKDATLEQLADKGNGNYAYIDTVGEARKTLVEQISGTLVAVAKDVKVQVEFNPAKVGAYRLIGYENRMLRAEDFKDDRKDAGDIGAGLRVTALYELVPSWRPRPREVQVDPLKYQAMTVPANAQATRETLTVKLRYKWPDKDNSHQIEVPVVDRGKRHEYATADFKFAAAVASFGMIMRDSPHSGDASLRSVTELAHAGRGADLKGYRREFIDLARRAQNLRR